MSVTMQTLGIILAGVVVILLYIAVPVTGAILGKASPLNYAIYLGDFLSFLWLSLIVYMSFGRTGNTD